MATPCTTDGMTAATATRSRMKAFTRVPAFFPALSKKGNLPVPLVSCTRGYGYVHVEQKKPPHILGPGRVWRKCNVVHPHTEILDPLTKYQWITKAVAVPELPDVIQNVQIPVENILIDFKERANDYLAFQNHDRPKYRIPELKLSGFLQASLASIWPLGDKFPHLVNSHLTFEPTTECYWRRDGHNFICKTNPLYIMHTSQGLDMFCDPDIQKGTIPPMKFMPSHLGVFERSFDQITPFGGCRRHGPYPMTHTVFMSYRSCSSIDQLLAHGLMQLFAQAAGEGVHKGFKLDVPVPFPLVNQGIITDGQYFTFTCFQLNTLDFRQDTNDQRKNVFWAGPTMKLYEKVVPGKEVVRFNEDCALLIIKFLLNRTVRGRKLRSWDDSAAVNGKRRRRQTIRIPGN